MERQITYTKFEVGIKAMEQAADGRFDLLETPVTVIEATAITKAAMRKAIIEAGVPCPRGTEVYAKKVGAVRYFFDSDALKSICTRCEELPAD